MHVSKLASMLIVGAVSTGVHGQVTYKWDDGTGSVNSGPIFAAPEFMWGNVFTTQPGGETITSISVAFGKIAANAPMWLYIYQDPTPDNDPTDAVMLLRQPALTNPLGGNNFATYSITPTTVTGDFFIAVSTPVNGTSSDLPARLDPQGSPDAAKSWFFASDGFDIFTLAQAPYKQQLSLFALPSVVMVRAEGVPAEPCYADCDGNGTLNIDDFLCFQSLYALGDPAADCDEDGVISIDDFVCFQTLYALGC
jgi:hypothetical protein